MIGCCKTSIDFLKMRFWASLGMFWSPPLSLTLRVLSCCVDGQLVVSFYTKQLMVYINQECCRDACQLNLHILVILLKSCVYLCVLEIIVYLMLLISFTPSLSSWIKWLKWVWSKGAGQKGRGPRSIFSSLALSETLFTWPVFWPVPPPHTHTLSFIFL